MWNGRRGVEERRVRLAFLREELVEREKMKGKKEVQERLRRKIKEQE